MKVGLTVRRTRKVVTIRTRLVLVTHSTLSYAVNLIRPLFAGGMSASKRNGQYQQQQTRCNTFFISIVAYNIREEYLPAGHVASLPILSSCNKTPAPRNINVRNASVSLSKEHL